MRYLLTSLALLGAAPARAQEQQPPPSPEQIAKAVRDLGDKRFTVREKASAVLWAAGKPGERALLKALAGADLETTRRAQTILDKFRWGVYPDTPKEALDFIARYRQGTADVKSALLRNLLDRGPQWYGLAARLLTAEDKEDVRGLLSTAWREELDKLVRERLRGDDHSGLEDLLRIRITQGDERAFRDYAVYHLLTGGIGEAVEHHGAYAMLQGHRRDARVVAYLHRVKGDLVAARTAAANAADPHLLQAVLWDQRDWKALAALGEKLVGTDPHFLPAFQRLAGDGAAFEKSVAELVKLAADKPAGDGTIWWEAKSLFLNDRPEAAMKVLARAEDDGMTLDVLARQRRYNETLALLDRYRSHDGQSKTWAALKRVKILLRLGEKEAAVKLLDGSAKAAEAEFYPYLHGALLESLRLTGRHEEAMRRGAALLEKGPPPPKKQGSGTQWTPEQYADALLRGLFPDEEASALRCWWDLLRAKHPKEDALANLKRLEAILTDKVPAEDLARLVSELETAGRRRWGQKQDSSEWFAVAAAAARRTDREGLVRACLSAEAIATEGDSGHVKFAKYFLGKQQWASVVEVCVAAHEKHSDSAPLTYLHGHALTKLGKAAEGRRLMDRARLMPLADDQRRHGLAAALEDVGLVKEARQEFTLLTRSAESHGWYTGDSWRQLSRFATGEKDYLAAADGWERWSLGVIGPGSFFMQNEPYVSVPYRGHVLRARGLLARGDTAGAWKEIQVARSLLPAETELATTFVPALAKAGGKEEAEELYVQVTGAFAALVKQYPRCGWAHNALAWTAAACRRDLDRALEHATAAVKLEPDNTAYLDTLAETHFQRGEAKRAVELARRCQQLAPDNAYYRSQQKRFEAGDPSAPLPD